MQPAAPTKRSSHVALLLAGTVAVGGGAYALMPGENCAPNQPGMAAPANAGCSPRSSSSGGGGSSRYGFYSGDSIGEQIGVRHVAIEFRHRHARRFWVVRARLHVAFFRRRLNLFRRTML